MKKFVWLLVAMFALLFVADGVSEARCGGRGLFRGRRPIRTFFRNHRPHLFRGGC